MAKRRDDIVAEQRVQIALEMLSPHRPHGLVSALAQTYHLSCQALYDMSNKAQSILRQAMAPGGHGAQAGQHPIKATPHRLQRGVVTLSEHGVRQRGITDCLAELLDCEVSLGWVNGELARLEKKASAVLAAWQPDCQESLAGDEIFSNGQPNLLVVGNESLYLYALSRQTERDGQTWGCILLDLPCDVQMSSDGGKGLAAGLTAAGMHCHQLDWDHLLRPLWGQVTQLERQAMAALSEVEARARQFDLARTTKRLQHHLKQWEILNQRADEKMSQLDTLTAIVRVVDNQFALIDLSTGYLLDAAVASRRLRDLGQQLTQLPGRIYQRFALNLTNWAPDLFAYQVPLRRALAPVQAHFGTEAVAALCRIWQCEADMRRHRLSLPQQQYRQRIWCESLDIAYALLGEPQLWVAWEVLASTLNRVWRGSMLAECVNSRLRRQLNQRKQTDQGTLDLFRFFHNVRPLQRGKRAGQSPAQLVGLSIPKDPLTLLGLHPKCQANSGGF